MKTSIHSVEAYLSAQPDTLRPILKKLRKTIKAAAPQAEELISYGMPAYKLNGPLVYFAAYAKHIGFYPTGSGIEAFKSQILGYKHSKGAIQFPLDKPLPFDLVTHIVKYKLAENVKKLKPKNTVKKPNTTIIIKRERAEVDKHIRKLDKNLAKSVNVIRKTILACDQNIAERVKWNNPSFYYHGDMKDFDPKEYKRDLAVFNLFKGRIMLVFPTGEKIGDTKGFLEGDYKDGRRILIFNDLKDIKAKQSDLQKVIKKWIKLVDK